MSTWVGAGVSANDLRRCVMMLALPLVSGCGSLGYVALPDPVRTKQAGTVQTDFKAVDLDAAAAAAPALLKSQLDAMHAEQESFEPVQTAAVVSTFVDALLVGQVIAREGVQAHTHLGGPVVYLGLRSRIDAQLQTIVSDDRQLALPSVPAVLKARDTYQTAVIDRNLFFQGVQSDYTKFGLGAPNCADVPGAAPGVFSDTLRDRLEKLAPNDGATAKFTLEQVRKKCVFASVPPVLAPVYEGRGLLASAHARLVKAQARQAADVSSSTAKHQAVDKAQAAYNTAVASAGATTPTADAVKAAAGNLVSAIGELQSLAGRTNGWADTYLAQLNVRSATTQLNDISAALPTAQASGGFLPTGTKNPAAAIVLATRLLDDQHQMDTALVRSQELPPQLVLAQEQLQLQQAQATVTADQQRIDLMQQVEDTIWDEAKHLVDSQAQLNFALDRANKHRASGRPPAHHKPRHGGASRNVSARPTVKPTNAADCDPEDRIPADPSKQTFEQMFCVNPPDVREAMLLAAMYYVAAQGRLEKQRLNLEYDIIDVDDQLSVAYSAINLKRWNALLAPTVDEVVTFNTFDSNYVALAAQILQTLGVAYIGIGVN